MNRNKRNGNSPRRTKVLIVDDHPAVREGLASRIDRQPDLHVCGEAADVTEALRQVAETQPDVAVIDISLKDSDGIELVKRLKARAETVRILIWSMHSENLYAERALRAGAMGYITKENATDQIIEAIRQVRDGRIYLSQKMSDRLLKRTIGHDTSAERPSLACLSDRELEVFRYLSQGLDPQQISGKMHLSVKTVETYQARMKEKLNLVNGRELIQLAARWAMDVS